MTGLRVLVLGASGRLGGVLRRHWPQHGGHMIRPIWQFRRPVPAPLPGALCFDPLHQTPDCGPVDVVLGLAGVVPGAGDLACNVDLGLAALRLGVALGARHVFLSSSAAVYGTAPEDGARPLAEDDPLCPASPYGAAKRQMEQTVSAQARHHSVSVCALRIGNVAGADALLGQDAGMHRVLDQFADGQGPRRSYIGPCAFSELLARLVKRAGVGAHIPQRLNLALDGPVAMEDLCHAAGLGVHWRPAPPHALPCVVQDMAQLARLVPVGRADARAIIADWRTDGAQGPTGRPMV
ncbi:NAD-dependent epimerase/dehydratase family protein [Roseinatronobacter sp. NSM]|uniref:NAD-dependent epimerase/dehydratase family protein n=1 Tax=Roseinatronobacter sp. NSM TaxID=3457785 RepID=UPI0040351111